MWWKRAATQIWIFAVGRGNATFVRSGLNHGFLVDMGCGADFSPSDFVRHMLLPELTTYKKRSIAQAVLSHPHADHIKECGTLGDGPLRPELLTCPHDKSSAEGTADERLNWARIKDPDNEELIATYRALYQDRRPPLQTLDYDMAGSSPGMEYGLYYVRPPVVEDLHDANDSHYGNATSVMMYWRQGKRSILLPGDMTPAGMQVVLDADEGREKRYTVFDQSKGQPDWHLGNGNQPELRTVLAARELSVLVAPHHGLESCFSEDLYCAMYGGRPRLVIISERRHKHEGDGKVDSRYQSEAGASGWTVNIDGDMQFRRSVSTVDGHHYVVSMPSGGPMSVFGSKDPEWLLSQL